MKRGGQIYMDDSWWEYVDSLKVNPEQGRGAVIADILAMDKKRRERILKQKPMEKEPAANGGLKWKII